MLEKIKRNLFRVLSVNWLKSIFVNVYYVGKYWWKLPILIGYSVHIESLGSRQSMVLPENCGFATICIGLKCDPFKMGERKSYLNLSDDSRVEFRGTCRISKGSIINVSANGKLEFGNHFTSNSGLFLSCGKHISFGEDVLLGWNVNVIDGDGHQIRDKNNNIVNFCKEVVIGDHVWIGYGVSILKGFSIGSNSVIAANTVAVGSFPAGSVIAGNPGKIVKNEINWKH